MRSVAVVVPAHDEERLVPACLRSVLAALDAVPGLRSEVVVVASRCTDATAAVAARVLGARGVVLLDSAPHAAGARAAGAAAALARSPAPPAATWLLSTDADSTVPRDWLRAIARHAARGADAVAGLVDVRHDPSTPARARDAYAALVRAGHEHAAHRHAYGANLAVRGDAYLAAGGWPPVGAGEDHALLDALRTAGRRVVAVTDVVVRTSGRRTPRARGGLGTLLDGLAVAAGQQAGNPPPAHGVHEAR